MAVVTAIRALNDIAARIPRKRHTTMAPEAMGMPIAICGRVRTVPEFCTKASARDNQTRPRSKKEIIKVPKNKRFLLFMG